jgi:glycerol-3-phosphate dehydrogenase subunit C
MTVDVHADETRAGGVLGELMRDSLDHCVKCTICETQCPFSNATPLFPGPKYVGPQAERFRVAGEPSPDASLDYCSSCGICTQVCPHGVHIAEINTQAKAELRKRTGVPLRDQLLARPTVAGRLGTPVAPLANWTLANKTLRRIGEATIGLHRDAPMPQFAGRTFQKWARAHEKPAATRRVAYFHGCGANYYEPRLAEMTVALLEHNGVAVEVPRQDCCGLPAQSNGLFDTARGYVRRLVAKLVPYARDGVDIVATSTSCCLMLKREAREILGLEDDPDLRLVSSRIFDIAEYLLAMHDRGELNTDFRPVPETVTYHAPCQQRGHGIGKPALDLLALIPELTTIELDAACCGVAGTYGLKKEKYDISMKVGSELFGQIAAAPPGTNVCDSETCRWQIQHATGTRSVHPVELLHRAAGLP